MTIKEHRMLTETIDRLVRESINEMMDVELDEEKKGSKKSKAKQKSEAKEKSDKKHSATKGKLRSIIKWLKSDEVNQAAIMRKLWHPTTKKQEDALRSEFSKKVNGKDATGKKYSFDPVDQNHLYSIKSNSSV